MCMTNGACGEILIISQHETKSLKQMLAVWGHLRYNVYIYIYVYMNADIIIMF